MTHSGAVTLRARTGLALLAATTLLLTSCTGTDIQSGNTQSAPPTGDTTQSAPQMSGGYEVSADGKLLKPTTPTPPAPTPPSTLTQDTPQAAQDFARYFVAVAEHAWNTGDSTQLRDISTPDCHMCTNMADAIDTRSSSGGWTQGLRYDITESEAPVTHPDDHSTQVVVLHVTVSGAAAYDGTRLLNSEVLHDLLEIHTSFTAEGWRANGGGGARDPDKS